MKNVYKKILLLLSVVAILIISPFFCAEDKYTKLRAETETTVSHNNGQGRNAISSDAKLFCNPDYDKSLNLLCVSYPYNYNNNGGGYTINSKWDNSIKYTISNTLLVPEYFSSFGFYLYYPEQDEIISLDILEHNFYYTDNFVYYKIIVNLDRLFDNVGQENTPYLYLENHNYLVFNIYDDNDGDFYFNIYKAEFLKIRDYFKETYRKYKFLNESTYYNDNSPYSYEFYVSFNYSYNSLTNEMILSYMNLSIITPTYTIPIQNQLDLTTVSNIKQCLYPISTILYYECYYTWYENKNFYQINVDNNNVKTLDFFYTYNYEYITVEFVVNMDTKKVIECNQSRQFIDYKKTNNNKNVVTYLLYNTDYSSFIFPNEIYSYNENLKAKYSLFYNANLSDAFYNNFSLNDNLTLRYYKPVSDLILGTSSTSGFITNNATFQKSLADTCGFNSSYYISLPSGVISPQTVTNFDFYEYNKSNLKLYNQYDNYLYGNYFLNYNNTANANNVFSNYNELYNKYTYLSSDVFNLGFKDSYQYNDRGLIGFQYANLDGYLNSDFLLNERFHFYNFSFGLPYKENNYYTSFLNSNNLIIGNSIYNIYANEYATLLNGNNNIGYDADMYLFPIHQITLSINPSIANLGLASGGYSQSYNNGELEYVESSGIWDWNANLSNALIWIINNIPFLKEVRMGIVTLSDYLNITFELADNIKVLFPSIIISSVAIAILCSFIKKSVDK